jgi:orotidine-5'-phosphate decarboxylase
MADYLTREREAAGRRRMAVDAKERLIVALDFASAERAMALVDQLAGLVSFFKVGIELQLAEGISPVNCLVHEKKKKVFLDLKYFDVPETVERAVHRAASMGVSFLTIHGNRPNIRAAIQGRKSGGNTDLKLLAVTVLTSLDADDIRDLGFQCSIEDLVLLRAKTALKEGCDGVIASGQEARKIRELVGKDKKLLIVTPGIRPEGFLTQDQKRVATPREAVLGGADYLVVFFKINCGDRDLLKAAERIIEEMQQGFAELVSRPT